MADLMRTNQGLASRFKQRVEFADWSPERCAALLARLAREEGLAFGSDARALAEDRCEALSRLPHWANARDVRTLFDDARSERAVRVLSGSEPTPTLTVDDLGAACDKMLAARGSMAAAESKRGLDVASSPFPIEPLFASAHRSAEPIRAASRLAESLVPEAAAKAEDEADAEQEQTVQLAAEEAALADAQRELQAGVDVLRAMKTLSREDAGEDSLEAALERGLADDPDLIAGLGDRDLDHPGVRRAIEETIARQIARGMSPDEARRVVERETEALLKHSRSAREVKKRLEKALKQRVPVYACGYCGSPWGRGPGQCTYMGPVIVRWETVKNV
jgi:hypothetical protein